jgi:hypothetical protein
MISRIRLLLLAQAIFPLSSLRNCLSILSWLSFSKSSPSLECSLARTAPRVSQSHRLSDLNRVVQTSRSKISSRDQLSKTEAVLDPQSDQMIHNAKRKQIFHLFSPSSRSCLNYCDMKGTVTIQENSGFFHSCFVRSQNRFLKCNDMSQREEKIIFERKTPRTISL